MVRVIQKGAPVGKPNNRKEVLPPVGIGMNNAI